MKTLNFFMVALVAIGLAACNDDDETSGGLTQEEQAEMVAATLGESGFSSSAEQSAIYANESLETDGGKTNACGYSTSETVDVINPVGTLITYSYSYDYEAVLNCSELMPESLTTTFSYSGEFDAPRLSSAHNGDGLLVVTMLDQESTSFAVNGSYDRTGDFESKVRNKNTGNSTVDLEVDDVMVNKTSYEIESGSATATITGTVAGKTLNFSAVVTFLGDGTATITINGTTYINDLESGEITEQ